MEEDKQGWRRRRLGRQGELKQQERVKLGKMLVEGAVTDGVLSELWTLARIGKLRKREFGQS